MKRSDFHYELPSELIAQHPLPGRSDSRLLALDGRGAITHRQFADLPGLLSADDLLVFNDTRVIPARLWGRKASGGRVEILVERVTGSHTALAHVRSSKSPKPGTVLRLSADSDAEPGTDELLVTGREGDLFCLESKSDKSITTLLTELGHMPLPPYIERSDEADDKERYQTVYAEKAGAVAAPTAGLHFTQELLATIDTLGVQRATVTLHVGAGTFQPVRADHIEDHVMHAEYIEVPESTAQAVRATRERGGRVVAVGTTSVRALESASVATGAIDTFTGDTEIFIYPGYEFRSVDAMITNFHLPESTLLMLVSAFAGRDTIMTAYSAAVAEGYRFFSYGDAMFLEKAQA